MRKFSLIALLLVFSVAATGVVSAEKEGVYTLNELYLSCLIEYINYDGFESESVTINAALLAPYKDKLGGSFRLFRTIDHEFWILSYGHSEVNNVIDIGSFQVAIKDKTSGLFVHARSNIDYTSPSDEEYRPKSARVSLVDYEPDSFIEKGELSLMCNQITESPLVDGVIDGK